MINVVDAIMGSGKTQAAITFIREHPDRPVLYITPYIAEIERIQQSCPEGRIKTPQMLRRDGRVRSKSAHLMELLESGCNVGTTHAMLKRIPDEIIAVVKKNDYTIILDEALDVFSSEKFCIDDLKAMVDLGYLVKTDCGYKRSDKEYSGAAFKRIINMATSSDLMSAVEGDKYYFTSYWASSCKAIAEVRDVYILTYMFEYQDLRYYFDLNGIRYGYKGVHHDEATGRYSFCELSEATTPGYVNHIADTLHIYYGNGTKEDELRMNSYRAPGENKSGPQSRTSMSVGWYTKNAEAAQKELKALLSTYFRSRTRGVSYKQKMWSTFEHGIAGGGVDCYDDEFTNLNKGGREKGARSLLSDPKWRKHFTVFNMRASNKYREKTVLAYMVNIFANPAKKRCLEQYDLRYDEDGYALSVMLQWIWRSAIRDGKEITIWVPSERMRTILENWIIHPYIAKNKFSMEGYYDTNKV